MPEGDVVWRTAQRLNTALAGQELLSGDLRWPSLAAADLSGRTVVEVVSAGKHLLCRTAAAGGAPLTLHSHLRMEGSWHVHATGAPWRTARAAHAVRAVLVTARWTAVGHRLGMLDLVPTDQEHRLVGHLGPDVLGPGWDPQRALENLRADPDRAVGEALLDQRVLAGVGTFFMAEALFVRGVTPWTPVRDVPDPAGLVALVHRMLDTCRHEVAQSTTGDPRPGRRQWVHARSGQPCHRCGTTVRVAMVGRAPQDRTAFYCPRCQRGPAPTDTGLPQRPLGSAPRAGGRRTAHRSPR
ncbi:DNA-formamidopyrimidine glycosylase family protein [Quadrisphaera sp. DSM 44207]|uniref:DNA-formamidopyrimidine glycosylase family protein n=1 Tax=Quadrisphaera sp. DSM 44207 TaxID=1881057 RepID=UPI00088E54A2|nr:DNA-formamidopyrimidine glycosylase family protein [Quadrisphaera sp. DSM 44207]SDQ33620.1 endonuclease-8 [Quadrisphaera sp. DSM 44207]